MGPRGDAILYTPALCCAAESAESRQKHLRISWQVYSVICGPRWDTVHTVRPCKHAVHDRPVRGRARHVAATRRAVASCCLSVSVCDPGDVPQNFWPRISGPELSLAHNQSLWFCSEARILAGWLASGSALARRPQLWPESLARDSGQLWARYGPE